MFIYGLTILLSWSSLSTSRSNNNPPSEVILPPVKEAITFLRQSGEKFIALVVQFGIGKSYSYICLDNCYIGLK